MKGLALLLAAGSLVALGSAVDTGVASAKKCHCKRGPRGPRGFTGQQGPPGPQGPPGASNTAGGGALVSNFNDDIPPGGSKTTTVGAFTISEVDNGSGCESIPFDESPSGASIELNAQEQAADYWAASNDTVGNTYQLTPPNSSTPLNLNGDQTFFSAVLTTGGSTVWGIAGSQTSGSSCLTIGGMAGD